MKLRCALLLLPLLVASCSGSRPSEIQSNDTSSLIEVESSRQDTLCYIGYVQKFDDNNFFFTDLYFSPSFDYDFYEDLKKMADEVIFSDGEVTRSKLEIEEAGQYFNLNGLNHIDIYNDRNQKIATGKLSHIEFVEDLIEDNFVAVFQVDNPRATNPVFCIGNYANDLHQLQYSVLEDETATAHLIKNLNLKKEDVWIVKHYLIGNQRISAISADTTAFIIDLTAARFDVLYKSRTAEVINQLTPISAKNSLHHVYLAQCGMPETDMLWTSVLAFNGTTYESVESNRIVSKLLSVDK